MALCLSLPCLAREWVSADGTKTFRGQLVEYDSPTVTVIREDDLKKIKFSDSKLSAKDKRYCSLASRVLTQSYPDFPLRVIGIYDYGILCMESTPSNLYYTRETFFLWGAHHKDQVELEGRYLCDLYWTGPFELDGKEPKNVRSFAPTLDEAVEFWEEMLKPSEPEDAPRKGKDKAQPKKQGMTWTGSGFALTKSGHIVTNAHVVEGASILYACLGEKKFKASVLVKDSTNDLAIIKIDEATAPLLLNAKAQSLGDDVIVAGFPNPGIQGRGLKVTKGVINGLQGIQDDPRHYQIDAAVQPGNSGGPLLDANLRVVGVVNSQLNEAAVALATGATPQNVNYAIKMKLLDSLIGKVEGLSKELEGLPAPDSKSSMDSVMKSMFLIEAEMKN